MDDEDDISILAVASPAFVDKAASADSVALLCAYPLLAVKIAVPAVSQAYTCWMDSCRQRFKVSAFSLLEASQQTAK